ncbi:unnamed protein product [Mycena citricolor]|uniref:Dynamin N-terminal domain-containing protein n=1 Tax=Mycena citricolor TaxID=2018698 RepID=A0AAD2GW54_9AGAR|nr:unnamed protein product [Mycena citricolor]
MDLSEHDSELTEMSDSDMDIDDPPASIVQRTSEFLLPKLALLERILPSGLDGDWKEAKSILQETKCHAEAVRPYKVALLGRTVGSGKSTLLNALLRKPILAASAAGACTAVITEISYNDTLQAEVEFKHADQWRKELCTLYTEATDNDVDSDELQVEGEELKSSAVSQARERMRQLFPGISDKQVNQWPSFEAFRDDNELAKHLGTSVKLNDTTFDNFQKNLETFLASTLSQQSTRQLWPIVRVVRICGPFEILSTGVTLVDLPGFGDVDHLRDAVAASYLEQADAVLLGEVILDIPPACFSCSCLVAGISRAKDDKDVNTHLNTYINQCIVDGRVQDRSIAVILTGADNRISSNEFTLEQSEQVRVNALESSIQALLDDEDEITRKLEKKMKSKSRSKKHQDGLNDLQNQVQKCHDQRVAEIKQRNTLLAKGRAQLVELQFQNKFKYMFQDLAPKDKPIPNVDIPVFAVGSKDFMCLKRIETDDAMMFSTAEETGIPRLTDHLRTVGERRALTHAQSGLVGFCDIVQRADKIVSIKPHDAGTQQETDLTKLKSELDQKCAAVLDRMLGTVNDLFFHELQHVMKTSLAIAKDRSTSVFEKHTTKKWFRYRTLMRQEGVFEKEDINVELTQNELVSVLNAWNDIYNYKLGSAFRLYYEELRAEISTHSLYLTAADPLRAQSDLDLLKTVLNQVNSVAVTVTQRQGVPQRAWPLATKAILQPQYEKAAAQKGPGMYKRMKLNRDYMHMHGASLFQRLEETVNELNRALVITLRTGNDEKLKRHINQLALGSITIDPVPEKTAMSNTELKTFIAEHEDIACHLLDEIKNRLQALVV